MRDLLKKGFIRTSKTGPGVDQQKAALNEVGLDTDDPAAAVFIDDRDAAIASLEPGDELVIASADCLGYPESDVLAALAAIGRRNAAVYDVSERMRIEWHPDADRALRFAVRAGSRVRKSIAAHARRSRVESGNLGGIPAIKWEAEDIERLRSMFRAGEARQSMADAFGVSRATIQRKLRELGLVQP